MVEMNAIETDQMDDINPRYITGTSDEPKQILQPILGYAHVPLVPLEEACQPLLNIVPCLPTYIWIAKENSKHSSDGLTRDESAAIHLYTMEWDSDDKRTYPSLYTHLNRTLKLIDRTKLRPWFSYLKLFLTALAKLPHKQRQIVWRGVKKNVSDDYPPGTEITWWAFSSCTASLNVLDSDLYLGKEGMRTIFSIEAINARSIRSHSHFQTEDEILLLPGSYFEIKSRLNPAPGLYIIHLQQKIPPHVLLEPPFQGAELLPPSETDESSRKGSRVHDIVPAAKSRPWYKNKKILVGIGVIVIAIIMAIILGAVLGSRHDFTIETTTTKPISTNNSTFDGYPTAFYSFDNNIFDLYSLRNGVVEGGPVQYVVGYLTYGKAIVLNQMTATEIHIQPAFDLSNSSSFTIGGFFMLEKEKMNATLVQLTTNIGFYLINGILTASLGLNLIVDGTLTIPTNQWYYLSLVYNSTLQTATMSIDGNLDGTRSAIKLNNNSLINTNEMIVIGTNYQGRIDQLTITLKAKSPSEILWDATTIAYYPLDVSWLNDLGPNDIMATSTNVQTVYAWRFNGINFNLTDSYFQADGFTALGTPAHAFSIAVWVRTESQPGVFLTVSNPFTCLLVVGIQNDDNRLVVYLPNATQTGENINIVGPVMPLYAWVHFAFTWSSNSQAKLYTSGFLQGSNSQATLLNNARGQNNSLPMTITLGQYHGAANCQGIQGVNVSQQFKGSLDELYIFSRELQIDDLVQLETQQQR